MSKKVIIISMLSVIIIVGVLFLSMGGKMAGIIINEYRVSEDGQAMTLKVGVASSMGCIRTVKEKQDKNKKYLTFYSTFGFNSRFGAKNKFEIKLDPTINEIYFYRGDDGFAMVLHKNNETKEWERE